MIIDTMKICNFRGYKDEVEIKFNDLTTIIGQNDIGKSTILEALDIFLNDGKGNGIIKMDKSDVNVSSNNDETTISVTFKDYPSSLVVDETVETSLEEEYLLNADHLLEVKKIYRNGSLKDVVILSEFPNHDKSEDLHSKKISELRKIAKELDIEVSDNRKASLFRKEILKHLVENDVRLTTTAINVKGTSTKELWESIQKYLPLFMLFQSDRENQDQDSIVQDPMKMLMTEIIKEDGIEQKLNDVFSTIKDRSEELSRGTLEKLEEMNSELAKELNTEFEHPSWLKAFKFSLETDDKIPANKRGSGVRRLILLNFFRAEAERRKEQRNIPHVIYGFEEPETSQHPQHQKMLIEAFIEMSAANANQVVLTTHSPAIAKMLPVESLRLIKKDIYKSVKVYMPNNTIIQEIVDDLGVFSDIRNENLHKIKLAICVEGKNDITFLKEINKIGEFKSILDVVESNTIILPMGGSTLQFWVNENYLNKLNLKQLHIYDSDIGSEKPNKYKRFIDILNDRENCRAFETKVREFENYIPIETIKNFHPNIEDNYLKNWDESNVPEIIARRIHSESIDTDKIWEDLKDEKKKQKVSKAKKHLNEKYLKYSLENGIITKENKDEIKSWLYAGKALLQE